MKVKIVTSRNFRKEASFLLKKYPSLKDELLSLEKLLQDNPFRGIPLGHNCYKIKISIRSKGKGKGKSGGARIITFIVQIAENQEKQTLVNLASIYDKSQIQNISDSRLRQIINEILDELDL